MPYKEGNRYRAKVALGGQRYTKLFATKKEAITWEVAKRKELESTEENLQKGQDLLTICSRYSIYSERYSNKVYQEKKAVLDRILDFLGSDRIIEPLSEAEKTDLIGDLENYFENQKNQRSANASNKDRKNLMAMWNKAKKWGVTFNPILETEKYTHDRKPQYTPSAEDVLKVILAATRSERVMLDCYLHTAARRSEIFSWNWLEDINFERRMVRLSTRKTKDGSLEHEWIPMGDELYDSLKWWWDNRKFKNSPYVFVDDHPGAHFGKPFKVRRRFIKGLCKRAGVTEFGFHALRRFVASRLKDKGKSTKAIQRLLRHKNLRTTEVYIQSINDDMMGLTDNLFDGIHVQIEGQKNKKALDGGTKTE